MSRALTVLALLEEGRGRVARGQEEEASENRNQKGSQRSQFEVVQKRPLVGLHAQRQEKGHHEEDEQEEGLDQGARLDEEHADRGDGGLPEDPHHLPVVAPLTEAAVEEAEA